jgi:hypothetical protein
MILTEGNVVNEERKTMAFAFEDLAVGHQPKESDKAFAAFSVYPSRGGNGRLPGWCESLMREEVSIKASTKAATKGETEEETK